MPFLSMSYLRFTIRTLILLLLIASTQANAEEKNILVLHSYHHGLEWTDSISAGISSVIPKNSGYNIFFEYLDTKRNSGKAYYDKLKALYREKSFKTKFDIIIVSDNAALNFILENQNELFPGVPVVFCGINNFSEKMLQGRNDIAGIVERADHAANITLISKLHPNLHKLIIVNDRTLTGTNIKQELLHDLQPFPNIQYEYVSEFTIDELRDKITRLNPNDVIYLLVINRDRNGKFISYRDGIQQIKSISKVPIYGAWDFYLNKGIVGGKIISGFQHGAEAAKKALKIINDQSLKEKISRDAGNRYAFDYKELSRFHIKISDLPYEAKILNQPRKFYQTYASQLLILFQVITIYLIIFVYFKSRQNKVFSQLLDERTRELRDSNEKLRRISITDALTGLHNRKTIMERLSEHRARVMRYQENASICMFDIDYFKNINDQYGHPAGDKVLREIGRVIRQNLREGDVAGRYGGEEFIIILPNTDIYAADVVAKKLVSKIKQLRVDEIDQVITLSGGICPLYGHSIEEVLQQVDTLLYEAKEGGRDQMRVDAKHPRYSKDKTKTDDQADADGRDETD